MATVNKSAAAKRAAAEGAGVSVKIKFLGNVYSCPSTLPGTFAFDALSVANGNEGALFGIIQSVFDDEQMNTLRESLSEQSVDDGGAELLGELFNTVTEAYGVGEGE